MSMPISEDRLKGLRVTLRLYTNVNIKNSEHDYGRFQISSVVHLLILSISCTFILNVDVLCTFESLKLQTMRNTYILEI